VLRQVSVVQEGGLQIPRITGGMVARTVNHLAENGLPVDVLLWALTGKWGVHSDLFFIGEFI
jgi:hypothetical protein